MLTELPDKRRTLDAYLMHGETHVLVDARQPGVSVPDNYRGNSNLILKISYRYGTPLEVSDWGIRITLSFDRHPFPVQLPWSAIYAAHALTGDVEAWPTPQEPPVIERRRGILGVVH